MWVEDKDQNIWVGTQFNGIYKISTDVNGEFVFSNFVNDRNIKNSLANNSINTMIVDSSGNIWIGTNGSGLEKINENLQKFGLLVYNHDKKNTLTNPKVTTIVEDYDGSILIGTNGGGINIFDPNLESVKPLILPNKNKSLNYISKLFVNKNDELLIAPYRGGLYKLTKNKKELKKLEVGKYSKVLNSINVLAMIEDEEDNLWLGLNDSGIIKINYKKINLLDTQKIHLTRIVWFQVIYGLFISIVKKIFGLVQH